MHHNSYFFLHTLKATNLFETYPRRNGYHAILATIRTLLEAGTDISCLINDLHPFEALHLIMSRTVSACETMVKLVNQIFQLLIKYAVNVAVDKIGFN